MTSNNHHLSRELQQDARAWAAFTGTKYTAALRQMKSPFAQGLLGDRVSARRLIAALDDHDLIGVRSGDAGLGENGCRAEGEWNFDGETDFVQLALIVDVLRMFTPIETSSTPEVGSYALKYTVEKFLSAHCPYVTNGRLIWAAATLDLPITDPDGTGPNVLIGVPEREHDYVRRMVDTGWTKPQADHYRPPGY